MDCITNVLRMCACSVWYARRNLRRAGTLKNRSRTSIVVPSGQPHSFTSCILPPEIVTSVPMSLARVRVRNVNLETDAMEARASPRKPRVDMCSMSSTSLILLVAWRSAAIMASSRGMPQPSSETLMRLRPPAVTTMSTRVAPASTAFSSNSLTTEAGRSTTSPAAILFATLADSRRIFEPSPLVVTVMAGILPQKNKCNKNIKLNAQWSRLAARASREPASRACLR